MNFDLAVMRLEQNAEIVVTDLERAGRNAQTKSMARPDGKSVYVTLPADRKTPSSAKAKDGVF